MLKEGCWKTCDANVGNRKLRQESWKF